MSELMVFLAQNKPERHNHQIELTSVQEKLKKDKPKTSFLRNELIARMHNGEIL